MKMRILATAVCAGMGLLASVASAGAPMGPPLAYLGEGRTGVAGEYGYEQMDMTASGTVTERFLNNSSFFWTQRFQIDDLTSHMFFGTLAYGVCDDWDIFARVGAANGKDEVVALPADTDALERRDDFDGGFGLAWGAGTRATFCRSGPWSVGGLMQVTWFRPGSSGYTIEDPLIPDETWAGDVKLDYWQAQVSLAAAYENEGLRLWAGPFLQFFRGDMDFRGSAVVNGAGVSSIRWDSKIQEESQVGGHFGASWQIRDQLNLWLEGQISADSWLVGAGAVIVAEKTFDM